MTGQSRRAITVSPWFRHWQRRPSARIRLFCFPYAGGGASFFRAWSKYLPQEIEVCPVQLPGREERLSEKPFSTLSALLDDLVPLLLPYLDMPYAFFGHSMGALIGFELTRSLYQLEQGRKPAHLFVSGHRAPQLPNADPPISHLPQPEFIEELRRLKGTAEEVLQHAELLQLLLPLLRADFACCETYSYAHEQVITCPLSAFGGLEDTGVTRETLMAWREQTSGPFTVRFFPGNHFFLQKEQTSLLQALSLDLLRHVSRGAEGRTYA